MLLPGLSALSLRASKIGSHLKTIQRTTSTFERSIICSSLFFSAVEALRILRELQLLKAVTKIAILAVVYPPPPVIGWMVFPVQKRKKAMLKWRWIIFPCFIQTLLAKVFDSKWCPYPDIQPIAAATFALVNCFCDVTFRSNLYISLLAARGGHTFFVTLSFREATSMQSFSSAFLRILLAGNGNVSPWWKSVPVLRWALCSMSAHIRRMNLRCCNVRLMGLFRCRSQLQSI